MQSLLCLLLLLQLNTLFSLPSSALPTCSPSDLISLQAFQRSLSTPLPWTNHTNCCSWLGVLCNPQGRVVSLHLPSSNLSGSISPRLSQLSALKSLNLAHNSFHGDVAASIANLSALTTLDLSHNPSLINHESFLLPPNLHQLDLSHCSFHGSLIINASSLKEINISENFFSSLALEDMVHLRSLQTLDASKNLFSMSGTLQILSGCKNLRVLNLEHNYLGGRIPAEIGTLHKLEILRLRGNQIAGVIPHEVGDCQQIQEIWLDDNRIRGTIPKEVGKLALLTVMSLTNNRLEGPVPNEIRRCVQLSMLSLAGNMFTGEIPSVVACLPKLKMLHMDGNDCPASLASHSTRSHELKPIGEKWSTHACRITQSKAQNPYHHRHLLQSDKTNSTKSQGLHPIMTGVISGIVVFFGVLLIALMVALCRMKLLPWRKLRRCSPTTSKMPSLRKFHSERSQVFDPSLTSVSMKELAKATDGFHPQRVIGDGGFGLVYRAVLCDGRTVAVKKLANDGIQGKREFEAEIQTLGHIKHPNLVELLAFCSAGEERALVYEFMENGSLDTWLHERADGPQLLVWEKRIRIAKGAAKGLSYLHHECDPHVIHRDIKSSNILLGKDFEARIADFGLARRMSTLESHVSTEGAGTLGYMAPEYHMNLCATKKADVYSFGMLMLELASGQRPNSILDNKRVRTLANWSHHAVESGKESEILDPVFKEKPPPNDQVHAFIATACQCVSVAPNNRPTMKEVFEQLSLLNVDTGEGEIVELSAEL